MRQISFLLREEEFHNGIKEWYHKGNTRKNIAIQLAFTAYVIFLILRDILANQFTSQLQYILMLYPFLTVVIYFLGKVIAQFHTKKAVEYGKNEVGYAESSTVILRLIRKQLIVHVGEYEKDFMLKDIVISRISEGYFIEVLKWGFFATKEVFVVPKNILNEEMQIFMEELGKKSSKGKILKIGKA